MCELHGYAPGRGIHYFDGTLFEPGFSLEGVAAYPLAVDRYIRETNDDQIVEEPVLADTLYLASDDIAGRRNTNVPLYATEVAPSGNPAPLPYTDLRMEALYPTRVVGLISTGFGAVALLLALAGVYGVMTHMLAARRREFAVRLALGATPERLARSAVRAGLIWGISGTAAGIAAAIVLAQLLRGLLFGVPQADAPSLGGSAALLLAASVATAYLPARRLTRVDPSAALRD